MIAAVISEGREPAYGWVMVGLASLFAGVGAGSTLTISVFLKPLVAEFGWTRGETAFGYLAATLALGLGGIVMGALADRFSTRRIVVAGALGLGIAYLLLSRLSTLWQYYLFYVLMGGLGAGAFVAPLMANVGNWFDRSKGLAIGSATAGFGLVQSVLPYAAHHLILRYGWSHAYVVLGLGSMALLLPLAFLVRTPPALVALKIGEERKAPLANEDDFPVSPRAARRWISAAAVMCCITMATPMMHVVSLAQDRGVPPDQAVGVLSVLLVMGLFGRILFGKLADRLGGLRTYLLSSGIQTVLVFWFTIPSTLTGFYLLAAGFGLGFSGVMASILISVREMTPSHQHGYSMGLVTFFGWAGMGLGGYQAGLFFDLTGSYTLPFANAALAGVLNMALLLTLLHHSRSKLATPALA